MANVIWVEIRAVDFVARRVVHATHRAADPVFTHAALQNARRFARHER
jgi:hypothetical protein